MYLLIFSAGPVNITWAEESERVPIIIQCFFPAQATGEAVREALVLRDGRFNPAGRLPYTWYKYDEQVRFGIYRSNIITRLSASSQWEDCMLHTCIDKPNYQ